MLCKKCKNRFYMQAISNGKCIGCKTDVYTPHLPCYKLCKRCSDSKNLCQQCGEEVLK